MSQHTKLVEDMLAHGHDAATVIQVAINIIINLELKLANARRKGDRHALPPDWTLPDEGRSYALSLGWTDAMVAAQAAKFRDKALAKGYRYRDWNAAWRNWCTSPYQDNRNGDQLSAQRVTGVRPADLRVMRKERMTNAIKQLRLFGEGDLQQRARGAADQSNVVGFPPAGGQRS